VVTQAKLYRHTVGVLAVKDLYGTMINEGTNKGILVSTGCYGSDALNILKDKPIEVIYGGSLLYLLEKS
jgi:restriction system protein